MKLLNYINEKTNNAYKYFKLVSVIFDKSNKQCVFKFLYQNEIPDDAKDILTKLIDDYLGNKVEVVVKCKKAYLDVDLVKTVLFNFITKNYASVSGFEKNNINVEIDGEIYINLNCSDFQYKYLSNPDIKNEILDYMHNFFFESVEIDIHNSHFVDDIDDDIIDTGLLGTVYDDKNENKLVGVKVANITNVIGEVKGCPYGIKGINSALEFVEIAGQVMFVAEKSFETKRKEPTVFLGTICFTLFLLQ